VVRSEVLTAVTIFMMSFWVETPRGLVGAEDGDSMFLRNVGTYL
jgi:hypothetical protein